MNSTSISIRTARQDDFTALWQIAALDCAVLPESPLLVAEQEGQVVAALSLANGKVVADPFRRSAGAVALLRLRASQLPRELDRPRAGVLSRLRDRPALLRA